MSRISQAFRPKQKYGLSWIESPRATPLLCRRGSPVGCCILTLEQAVVTCRDILVNMTKATSDQSRQTSHEVKPNITKDVRQVKLQRQWPSSSKNFFQCKDELRALTARPTTDVSVALVEPHESLRILDDSSVKGTDFRSAHENAQCNQSKGGAAVFRGVTGVILWWRGGRKQSLCVLHHRYYSS